MKNINPSKISCVGADNTLFEISFSGRAKGRVYRLQGEHLDTAFIEGFHALGSAIATVYGEDLYSYSSLVKKGPMRRYSGGVPSKKFEEIYEMAMRAIKSGRLKFREVDQRDSKQDYIPVVQFGDGDVWYFKPNFHGMEVPIEDFLEWALSERMPISDLVSQALGFSKHYRGKFHPKKFVLQATVQVIWYYEHWPIAKLGEHPLLREMFDQDYCGNNSFRNIVKLVDPRPRSERGKPKATKRVDTVHYPPKPIPGISSRNGNFLALKTTCKALFNALKHLKPYLSSIELHSHPLVELCLVDRHVIIKNMAISWLAEVEASFPLRLNDF